MTMQSIMNTTGRMTMKRKPLIVGVSGPSGSGKSTLAQMLCERLPRAVVVNADK